MRFFKIYYQTYQGLAYADDIDEFFSARSLRINEQETKYMEIKKKNDNKRLDIVGNSGRRYSFERIGNFNYLGVKITNNREE